MPHYEVDSVRMALVDSVDQRITVYWNPKVETNAEGQAVCFFTTADSDGPYTIVVEGILQNGTVCRQEKDLFGSQINFHRVFKPENFLFALSSFRQGMTRGGYSRKRESKREYVINC